MSVFLFAMQPNIPAQGNRVYHYAYVTDKDHNRLYISEVAVVTFNEDFDWSTDEYIPGEMRRQYIDYVEMNNDEFRFTEGNDFDYKMSASKDDVDNARANVVKKYKSEGYKIIDVKDFVYD
jgi:hypothetical protein